jgi:hypothetical protein
VEGGGGAGSTTGRRSRCGSGAAPAAARSWPAGTPTATCRCSATPPNGTPGLALLVKHDDAEREFAYTAGADAALEQAAARGWAVVSVRDDWATVFTD